MLNYVDGDLIKLAKEGKFNVIVHGCNCLCNMGKGIAPQIKYNFPGTYEADLKTIKGDKSKLGTYSYNTLENFHGPNKSLTVINAYTQYHYRRNYRDTDINVDYEAIEKVFTKLNKDCRGCKIGIPKIGAGLAGGDWDIIEGIIKRVTPDLNITVVNYKI